MIEVNRHPSNSQLRQFAGIWLPLAAILGALWLWQDGYSRPVIGVMLALLATLCLAGLLKPSVVRPAFVGWMLITYPISWTVSHLLLAGVYYGIVTPVGLLLRLVRQDPLTRRFDNTAPTYWVARRESRDQSRYFDQF